MAENLMARSLPRTRAPAQLEPSVPVCVSLLYTTETSARYDDVILAFPLLEAGAT
jgi:hypothetical protein